MSDDRCRPRADPHPVRGRVQGAAGPLRRARCRPSGWSADADGAAAAADALGYPVVAKLCGDAHRPQDRAGPGAPRPRRRRRGARRGRRAAGRGHARRRRGRRAGGPDGAGQPRAHRRPGRRPAVRHDGRCSASAASSPRRVADVAIRLVPDRAGRRRGDDRRPAHPGAARPVPGRAGGRPRRAGRRAARPVRGGRGRRPSSCRPTSTR